MIVENLHDFPFLEAIKTQGLHPTFSMGPNGSIPLKTVPHLGPSAGFNGDVLQDHAALDAQMAFLGGGSHGGRVMSHWYHYVWLMVHDNHNNV